MFNCVEDYLRPGVSCRQAKKEIFWRNQKNRKLQLKNVYVCVRVCVDYICVLLRVVVYVIVSTHVCVCVCVCDDDDDDTYKKGYTQFYRKHSLGCIFRFFRFLQNLSFSAR